jgi:hypothetical protein
MKIVITKRIGHFILACKSARYLNRFLLFVTLFFIGTANLFGQTNLVSIEVNNKSNISDSIYKKVIGSAEHAVIFLCPIRNYKKEAYLDRANKFLDDTKLKNVPSFHLGLIFFMEEKKNNSKNPILRSKNGKDSLIISQLECLAYNCTKQNLDRSTKLSSNSIYYRTLFSDEKYTKLDVVDSAVCFTVLTDRILFYKDYISQLYKPKYSVDEKFDMLYDSVGILRREIDSLKQHIYQQNILIEKKLLQLNETKKKSK